MVAGLIASIFFYKQSHWEKRKRGATHAHSMYTRDTPNTDINILSLSPASLSFKLFWHLICIVTPIHYVKSNSHIGKVRCVYYTCRNILDVLLSSYPRLMLPPPYQECHSYRCSFILTLICWLPFCQGLIAQHFVS